MNESLAQTIHSTLEKDICQYLRDFYQTIGTIQQSFQNRAYVILIRLCILIMVIGHL